jgi:hypothetical protein
VHSTASLATTHYICQYHTPPNCDKYLQTFLNAPWEAKLLLVENLCDGDKKESFGLFDRIEV